jgi:DNA primase
MKKMKNMPGMGDIQSMLSKMGMNAGKGGGKVNVEAMQANINQKLKESKNRERLLKKLAEKKMAQAAQMQQSQQMQQQSQMQSQQMQQQSQQMQAPIENLVFSLGEKAERSSRGEQSTVDTPPKKKNKKNKKKN